MTPRQRMRVRRHLRTGVTYGGRASIDELSDMVAREIRRKLGEPSFAAAVFGEKPTESQHKCGLCGQSLSACFYYECMPHEVKLRYYAERWLMRNERRKQRTKESDEFFTGLAGYVNKIKSEIN